MRIGWATRLRQIDIFDLGISATVVLTVMYLVPAAFVFLNVGPEAVLTNAKFISVKSVFYSFLGIAAFYAGYLLLARRTSIRPEPLATSERAPWNGVMVAVLFLALFCAGFASKILRIIDGTYLSYFYANINSPLFILKFLVSLNLLHQIALALLFTHYYSLRSHNDKNAALWGGFAWSYFGFVLICTLLAPGGRFALLQPVLVFLITRHFLYKKSTLAIVIAGVLSIALVFPLKTITRDVTNLEKYTNQGIIVDRNLPWNGRDILDLAYYSLQGQKKIEVISSSPEASLTDVTKPILENSARLIGDSSMGRIGQAHLFGVIVQQYQDKDFLYGRTIPFFLNWLLVPNDLIQKTMGIHGTDDFALKAGVASDTMTGIGWTCLGDWYQNFGVAGVIFGMLLVGMVFQLIFRRLTLTMGVGGIFIYSMLWPNLMHGFEQSLAAAIGEALRLFIIVYMVQWILTVHRRKTVRTAIDWAREALRRRRQTEVIASEETG